MGEITTENGYAGMLVAAIEFEDELDGSMTVSMYDDGQEDALSCVFVTSDGGGTWSALSFP